MQTNEKSILSFQSDLGLNILDVKHWKLILSLDFLIIYLLIPENYVEKNDINTPLYQL